MLVADALRLGGAILSVYPDMLAPQLVGRLLPEIGSNKNIKNLLVACDVSGSDHCALIPLYHCLHTPGGPLKVKEVNTSFIVDVSENTLKSPILYYSSNFVFFKHSWEVMEILCSIKRRLPLSFAWNTNNSCSLGRYLENGVEVF